MAIHVRKIEDYNPGYKDRQLIWCKAYFKMVNSDPDFEPLDEIDKWRFMAFIMMELQTKKPLPESDTYWIRKWFDLERRSLANTISALVEVKLIEIVEPHNVTQLPIDRNAGVTHIRLEKSRLEKRREEPQHTVAVRFWMDEFKKEYPDGYIFQKKDGVAIAKLLKAVSLDEFKQLALWLIKTKEKWYCENRTPAILNMKVNEIRLLVNREFSAWRPPPTLPVVDEMESIPATKPSFSLREAVREIGDNKKQEVEG